MKQRLYSIQGLFFQTMTKALFDNIPGIGLTLRLDTKLIRSMYHGVVSPDPHLDDRYRGVMKDHVGESMITDFMITEDSLSFEKHYPSRPAISYTFKKMPDGTWHGMYHGPDCGSGEAKCVITKLNEEFFAPSGT